MDLNYLGKSWVRRLAGPPSELIVEPLKGNLWLTEGVWRLTGPAGALVVKTARGRVQLSESSWEQHWTAANTTETHWNYWRREYLAYTSGTSQAYRRCGIRPPLLLHHEDYEDQVTLILEDISGEPAMRWSLDTYLSCARLLGSAHAALSRPGSFTNHSWLCRDYLSDYSLEKPFDRTIIYRDHAWASLKALNEDAAASRTELTQFAASEPTLLRRARASPITLCHNDFWTRNLFASADGLVTLIDWAFVGKGAIGADIANLVASAGFDRHVEPGSLRDFGEDVFSSYACGLRQGGWTGTLAESRASYLASFGKYAWVVAAMLQSACEPSHPIYVGYGDGASMDFTAVAHTLRVLAEWTSGALT